MGNYILTQHSWKVLHDLIFTRVQHYVDVWLFNKNFNHFEGVYCRKHKLSWELDLSIRTPRFFVYCLEVSMNKKQLEKPSWKTVYSMILPNNNTKWVSSQLFGCTRAKLGPLGRGHLHHLVFIIELLPVLPVGHMDLLLIIYTLLCVIKWQEWGEIFEELAKEGGSFWNNVDVSMLFPHHLNWNLLTFLPELSHFGLDFHSYKQIVKIRLLRISKF